MNRTRDTAALLSSTLRARRLSAALDFLTLVQFFIGGVILTQPKIKTAAASDEASIAAVLALAFSTDPGARWAWPDPQQLLTHFPTFVKALAGAAFTSGSAY